MSDIWITSDTHWNHVNILKHSQRPFRNVEEMNECMVVNWNSKVKKGDKIYHLGDFAWGDAYTYAKYKTYLNGQIFLIKGNHDYSNVLKKLDGVFIDVRDRYMLKHDGHCIVLDHFPQYHWDRSHYNTFHCHGHTHGTLVDTYDNTGKILDVGVDTNNFFPYHVDEVIEIMKKKPNNINYLKRIQGGIENAKCV